LFFGEGLCLKEGFPPINQLFQSSYLMLLTLTKEKAYVDLINNGLVNYNALESTISKGPPF